MELTEIEKLQRQINKLRKRITDLEKCCCENRLTYLRLELNYFDSVGIPMLEEDLMLNDRLPGDDCTGAKAIVIMYDATLYVTFTYDLVWVIEAAAIGGLSS